jgi:phage gp36-like protein
MATNPLYFTKALLEARLSAKIVAELFDDNNDGTPDNAAIDLLRSESSGVVDGYFAPLGILPHVLPVPREVERLSLDVAVALCAKRHGEVVRQDWEKLMKAAHEELMDFREGRRMLQRGADDNSANQGGTLLSGDAGDPVEDIQRHWDNMGDY